MSFNSLQTGKHMGTTYKLLTEKVGRSGFNSLQTGKHMGTAALEARENRIMELFQFPTNGKAHGNLCLEF